MRTFCFLGLSLLFLASLVTPKIALALEPLSDDFQRANGATVGNGWQEVEDAAISVSIDNGVVLVKGTQDVDWKRNGISRNVNDISSVSVDFLCNDKFNMHLRVDDTAAKGYLEVYCWSGGPYSYANSLDGSWPAAGWVEIKGSLSAADKYNTLGIKKVSANKFQALHNNAAIGAVIDNTGIKSINKVTIAADSAKGTAGSLRIDNVVIDGGKPAAVRSLEKLSTVWGAVKGL